MVVPSEHAAVCVSDGRLKQARIWLVEISDDLVHYDLLSTSERKRFAAFHQPEHATQYAATRCVLKKILALLIGRDPVCLQLHTDEYGRPLLAGDDAHVKFSVAHARNRSLIAVVADGHIGVDLEHESALVDAEVVEFWLNRIGAPPAESLLQRWVRLEALVKAIGTGIADVDMYGFRATPGIIVHDVHMPQGWAGAVALPAWCREVEFRRWKEK